MCLEWKREGPAGRSGSGGLGAAISTVQDKAPNKEIHSRLSRDDLIRTSMTSVMLFTGSQFVPLACPFALPTFASLPLPCHLPAFLGAVSY